MKVKTTHSIADLLVVDVLDLPYVVWRESTRMALKKGKIGGKGRTIQYVP